MMQEPALSPARATRQRAAIEDALERSRVFMSAQELHQELKGSGRRVGLTTVYRTLQSLADASRVDALRNENGELMYRRCESRRHHHHLVCTSCGKSVEIASDELETWADQTARRHGFTAVKHVAEVYGLCSACS